MFNSYYEKVGEKTVCIDNEIPFSIPSSWCWQRLCSVCFINPSVNTDDASEVSFVTMKDIQAGFVNSFSSSKTLWKSVKTNFTHFQNEDIGLAKITPCFENRKSVIFEGLINGIGAGTTELNIIRVDQRILLNEYLLYLLKSDYLIHYGISKFTGAVGQQRFGGIALKQFLIPIPPFEEQKRLCNTIVGCLQYANSIGKNLSELNKNCNTLKSKILDSFFGEHSRYKSYYKYEENSLSNIATLITKGSTPTTYGFEYLSEGINFIKVENVNDYCVQHNTIKQFISETAHEFQKRSQLEKDDLLISIAGTLGRICLIKDEDLPANTNQAFAIVRGYTQTLLPDYLKWFVTWYVDSKSQQLGHGGGMNNLTLGEIKALKIMYPVSKDEQQQIIDKVNACLEVVSVIEGVK